jgi:hypothetical protein
MPSALAMQESIGHCTRDSGNLQPNRPESSFVHFTVRDEEGSARGWRRAGGPAGGGSTRERRPEPAKRQVTNRKVASARIGMPVGKLLAVETLRPAGESLRPAGESLNGR